MPLKQEHRSLARKVAYPALWLAAPRRSVKCSAMVRVRNEEEFLTPSIFSIVDYFDEIVIIDNGSTDRTPDIVRGLCERWPTRTRAVKYEHKIARPGAENRELARSPGGLQSPRLLANYYTWCLEQCSNKWVVKWDADMIAVPELGNALKCLASSRHKVLSITGLNVHSNGTHIVQEDGIIKPFEEYEPRIFPRRFSRYRDFGMDWEVLCTPYKSPEWMLEYSAPTYLHVKYCKQDPYLNNSPDGRSSSTAGDQLSRDLQSVAIWALENRGERLFET